jgi:NAD-dependent dihydropyrimidine dehydrogenase PreA subunit
MGICVPIGVTILLLNATLLPPGHVGFLSLFAPEALLVAGVAIWSLIVEIRSATRPDHLVSRSEILPRRYRGRHPIRTVLETVFRLFPNPEPVGLYRVGEPGRESDVVVTGNYELTVRRVVQALAGSDCWLLVCDSRGINIWCSTLAGHFGTDSIVSAVKSSGLAQRVDHRKLILPQLSAAGVSLTELKRDTGFTGQFGPVRIRDLATYRDNAADPSIRTVTFTARERLEMATGTLFIPTVLLGLIFNAFDPGALVFILPGVYAMAYTSALVFPHRFVRSTRIWALVVSAATLGAALGVSALVQPWPGMMYAITIAATMLYLVNEFEGWSPLVKFSFTGAYERASISVSAERCIGCGACVEVCPTRVYSMSGGIAVVSNLAACMSCKSCIAQCPVDAIEHSASQIDERLHAPTRRG